MYRKILVGYDDSDQAKDALALGKQLADATGAELVAAGVFQFDPMWGGYDPHFRDAEHRVRAQDRGSREVRRRRGRGHAEQLAGARPARAGRGDRGGPDPRRLRASWARRPDPRRQRRYRPASRLAVRGRHRAERLPRPLGRRDRRGRGRFRRLRGIRPRAHGRDPARLGDRREAEARLGRRAAADLGREGRRMPAASELTEAIQEEMRSRLAAGSRGHPRRHRGRGHAHHRRSGRGARRTSPRRRGRCWSSAPAATARCGGCCSGRCRRSSCARRPAR